MSVTQNDIDIVLQKQQKINIRLDVYNTSNVKIGDISGFATTLTGNISATSNIRRTANITMLISDKSLLIENHSLIWLNRRIKIYVGLYDNIYGVIRWYLMGTYVIADSTYTYNETTQELSLPLLDLMACTTDQRGSQINGYGLTIYAGTNIRTALISIITNFTPYHDYDIVEFPDTIPYDLEFDIGVYPYDVLNTILSLYPTYEMYYSVDGVFTVAEIPTCIEDELFLAKDITHNLVKEESKPSSFTGVKNTTEIIGISLDADYTATTCTTSGTTYNLFIDDEFEVLEDGALFGFTPDTTSVSGQAIKIQDTAEYDIYLQGATRDGDTLIAVGAMTADIPYCVKYTENRFYLQGELEIHAIVQERNVALTGAEQAQFKIDKDCRDVQWVINPDSPFAADKVGEIIQVLSDGEYANIYTTQLALVRAAYENWKTTRLQDTIQLTMQFIPWMDVNKKIEYELNIYDKLNVETYSINDDGELIITNPPLYYPYSFDTVNGELILTYDESISTSFSINDDWEFIISQQDPNATYISKEISYDLSNFTTTIQAMQFYPYLPY